MKIVIETYICKSRKKREIHRKGHTEVRSLRRPCREIFTIDPKGSKTCPKCGFSNKVELIKREVY